MSDSCCIEPKGCGGGGGGPVPMMGDVVGQSDTNTVAAVRNTPWTATPPTDGQIPYFDVMAGEIGWKDESDMARPGNSASSTVTVTTSSTSLLAATPTRLGFTVRNAGSSTMYMARGPTATIASATAIEPDGIETDTTRWIGPVSAIVQTGTAVAEIEELTP